MTHILRKIFGTKKKYSCSTKTFFTLLVWFFCDCFLSSRIKKLTLWFTICKILRTCNKLWQPTEGNVNTRFLAVFPSMLWLSKWTVSKKIRWFEIKLIIMLIKLVSLVNKQNFYIYEIWLYDLNSFLVGVSFVGFINIFVFCSNFYRINIDINYNRNPASWFGSLVLSWNSHLNLSTWVNKIFLNILVRCELAVCI